MKAEGLNFNNSNISSCGEMIIKKDDFTIYDINQKTVELIGSEKEKLIGKKYSDILKNLNSHEGIIKEYGIKNKYIEECILHTKDKGDINVIAHQQDIEDNQKFLFIRFHDISFMKEEMNRRKELENRVLHTSKLESIGTLSAGIAHEINSPLQFVSNNNVFAKKAIKKLFSFIDNYSELIEMTDDIEKIRLEKVKLSRKFKIDFLREELPNAVDQSIQGIDRIAEIVNSMKNFSHMGNGQATYEDINKAIEATITISKNEWKYDVQLEKNLQEDLPKVKCYISDIKQVILNIIINAVHSIQYKKKNTEENGKIIINTYTKNKSVIIEISDTGEGIKKEIRDKIFNPFFTTKDIGIGTGQGLAISQKIIEKKHNGKLSFTTEEGIGTTFIIEIPINNERSDYNG